MAAARNSTAKKNESVKNRGTGSRSTSGNKKGGGSRGGKGNSRNTRPEQGPRTSRIIDDDDEKAISPERVREIYLFIYLAVAVFMVCSNFGICGSVGNAISGFFFGLFGWAQYLLPIYLFLASAFLLSNGPKKSLIRKLIWAAVFLMLISFIAQLIHGMDGANAKSLYMDGYTDHKGGGFFFGGFLTLLYSMIGKVGVIILTILLLIVAVIMITGFSVIDGFKKLVSVSYRDDDPEYEDDDEYEEEGYVPPAVRRRRTGQELQQELLVLPDNESQARKGGRKKSGKNPELPKEEMTELRPDPFNDDIDQLKEAARLRVRANQSGRNTAADTTFPGETSDASQAYHASQASQVSVEGFVPGGTEVKKGAEASGPEQTVMRDFFDLKPARESYEDGLGGDFDTAYGQEDTDEAVGTTSKITFSRPSQRASVTSDYEPEDEDPVIAGTMDKGMPAAKTAAKLSDGKPTHQDTLLATEEIEQELQTKPDLPKRKPYRIPPVNLLNQARRSGRKNDSDVRETAIKLKTTMESFGVNVTITDYSRGPAVTRYEMTPEQGVKVSKILSLQDDIKLNLAAADIRIEAPIPGKSAIGIEVPNAENEMVYFRELIDSDSFKGSKSKVTFALGKDIGGQIIVGDIAKMPHLLIAGATGSGKSVCVNTIIMSILYKAKPEEVRFIMVDPKQVELTAYNGIPHMLIPVVTDSKKAAGALNWAVQEMDRRYKLFAQYNVRNIEGFNKKVFEEAAKLGIERDELGPNPMDPEKPDFRFMPQIVVIVDELADLMMVAKSEVEESIVRLSQLARAAGIHLIIATQRPSVDVITGLIKANVPSRIAFAVSSGTDSRTILDMVGAEKLLGKGDMLYHPTGIPKPVRVQGAFVSDEEVVAVTDYIKKQCGDADYDESVTQSIDAGVSIGASSGSDSGEEEADRFDEYFEEAGRLVIEKDKASIGYLQRVFRIGFNRAARIMDQLAEAGVVGPEEGTKPRKILMTIDQFEEFMSI